MSLSHTSSNLFLVEGETGSNKRMNNEGSILLTNPYFRVDVLNMETILRDQLFPRALAVLVII